MLDFIFNNIYGWIGLAGIIVVTCVALGIIFPSLRGAAVAVATVAVAAAGIYAKGQRDRAALEKKRRDAAVDEVQKKYTKIDKRKDTEDDLDKKLRRGDF